MINISINGVKYQCPSNWEEVTVRQYIRIIKEWEPEKDIADRDYFLLFSILTNTDFATYKDTTENDVNLIQCVGWIITNPLILSKDLPKVFEYKGKLITIPKEPGELSIGQNIHLRRDYIDKSKFIEENLSMSCAIYLQPEIESTKTGPARFNLKSARDIAREIDQMPICKVYPIGFFFCKRALLFGLKAENSWLQILSSPRQMLKRILHD